MTKAGTTFLVTWNENQGTHTTPASVVVHSLSEVDALTASRDVTGITRYCWGYAYPGDQERVCLSRTVLQGSE
ncbi:hypothetical protein F4561_005405 [Lipingzhangella halophila]|uniref:Uncharacterized protein n=1 Tax=Lipingzhangella halophila TaxID=1783352 RepID=A0A7W7RM92_9ACTN|nr:hypothetical protein [Lipingzhangella halophila]MBB4934585.1 hypothetical protein [Lipingzhangella halophila]